MGFEPTTFCMASRRSSQLSYSRANGDYRCGGERPSPRGADGSSVLPMTFTISSVAPEIFWTGEPTSGAIEGCPQLPLYRRMQDVRASGPEVPPRATPTR